MRRVAAGRMVMARRPVPLSRTGRRRGRRGIPRRPGEAGGIERRRDRVAERRPAVGHERVERAVDRRPVRRRRDEHARSVEKATRPTRKVAGSWSTKSEAAFWAAARRVGCTSVAIIDRETSIARMMVASSRGTASVIDGRASARTSAPMAARYSTGGTCRRQAGLRGTRFERRSTFVKATAFLCGATGQSRRASARRPQQRRLDSTCNPGTHVDGYDANRFRNREYHPARTIHASVLL